MNFSLGETVKIKKDVIRFLKHYGMYFEDIDIIKHVEFFLDEMKKGLEDKDSSLKMLPTFIGYKNKMPLNKPVIVLDAGGTNFRSGILKFDDSSEPIVSNYKKSFMPGSRGEVSKNKFFKTIFDNIKDILTESNNIGFVFSYPIEIFPNKDGKLLKFTKEVQAKEVEGLLIGENLLEEIKKNGFNADKKIALLNDSVASLLAGLSAFQKRAFSSYVGFILGTGMNACYIEKNANIKKISCKDLDKEDYQIINIEAGNFSKGPISEIDYSFDKKTLDPGKYTFEKMLSGAYLGGIATEVLNFAIRDGILSKNLSGLFEDNNILESKDIDDFLYFPPLGERLNKIINGFSDKDLLSTYFLFDNLVERASIIAAIILSSTVIKSKKGINPCHPVCITAEGSSFYYLKNFRSRVDKYTSLVLDKMGPNYYEIHKVDNAIILGGAAAGLTI